NAVMRKIDAILKEQPGVHYINSVSGFSILSQTSSPRSGLAFVQLAPYDERATPALQADAVVAALNAKLAALPDAQAVALLPPAIPGVGQAGGVDFFIQYRGVEIFAVPAPGYSTGQAMAAVAAVADQVLPRDMGYAWNGMSYQESIAGSGLGVFALSLILVFLILAALYQSWSLPFSVL